MSAFVVWQGRCVIQNHRNVKAAFGWQRVCRPRPCGQIIVCGCCSTQHLQAFSGLIGVGVLFSYPPSLDASQAQKMTMGIGRTGQTTMHHTMAKMTGHTPTTAQIPLLPSRCMLWLHTRVAFDMKRPQPSVGYALACNAVSSRYQQSFPAALCTAGAATTNCRQPARPLQQLASPALTTTITQHPQASLTLPPARQQVLCMLGPQHALLSRLSMASARERLSASLEMVPQSLLQLARPTGGW